jgi:hypothetical protein
VELFWQRFGKSKHFRGDGGMFSLRLCSHPLETPRYTHQPILSRLNLEPSKIHCFTLLAKVAIKEGNVCVQAGSSKWKQEAVFRSELFSVSMVVLTCVSYTCVSFGPRHETNTTSPAVRPTTYLSFLLT